MTTFLRLCLLLALATLLAGPAIAQQRTARTVFVRPQGGVASYVGDNHRPLFSFGGAFPYTTGFELGYQASGPLSVSGGYLLGSYPGLSATGADDIRHTAQLFGRYTFGGDAGLAPYVQAGAHATFGTVGALGDERTETAFGPLLGLGLDVPLSGRLSLFVEGTTHASFPDDALDGSADGGFGGFDLLSSFGTGLKVNLQSGFVPVRIHAIDGPAALNVGQAGTFTARVNDDRATRPVEYRWEWGDGTRSTGMTATHTYRRAGSYTVRFAATSRGRTAEQTMRVTVTDPAVPAAIVAIRTEPASPDTRTPVRFTANVRGDQPLSYRWTFGDGATSTETSPTHTYDRAGSHTATLEVTNAAGSDRQSVTVQVQPFIAQSCFEVVEMNPVYFERNASLLTDDARRRLDDNVQILNDCPDITVRLEGHAAPGEREPQRLSDARAQAVQRYYRENGVLQSRMMAVGLGVVTGTTSKKDGAGRYQRVDTIPSREDVGASH